MTSIVSFEERMKSTGTYTDTILETLNRIEEAKRNGVLRNDEVSKEEILIGKMFANQVVRKSLTEEQVENFEKEVPKDNYFVLPHEGMDVAHKTIKQANTAALFDVETKNRQMQMPEGYTKGIRRAA